jgi:hypothetical protein
VTSGHTYLESKHGLKPVKEIFISLLLVVGLLLLLVVRVVFIVLVLGPWQAPSIPKGVNGGLNLEISRWVKREWSEVLTVGRVCCMEAGDGRKGTHLWILHNGLIGAFRIKWQDVVGNVELLLLLDFVVRVEDLRGSRDEKQNHQGKQKTRERQMNE